MWSFAWAEVERVCFKDGGLATDLFYVWERGGDEATIEPVEADGGLESWDELRARELFPDEVSALAVRSVDGGYYCWPQLISRSNLVTSLLRASPSSAR